MTNIGHDVGTPGRPAWVEVDLGRLSSNFAIFMKDKPKPLGFISVVKDEAYGHGMLAVAREALVSGATALAVATVDEAVVLRDHSIEAPILVFGERTPEEMRVCAAKALTCFVNSVASAGELNRVAAEAGARCAVHVEIDTGLSRYGVRWTEALPVLEAVAACDHLFLEGVMSHFAMSDELDKSFALLQIERFGEVLAQMQAQGISARYRHICNTGGFLDLPQAHFDLVRIGILPLGVYPSQVCRRISGLAPVMSVKTRIAGMRELQAGDYVGYGLRYQAGSRRQVAVLPIGYGDGYPRVRNAGEVLVAGRRAPIIGGNAMDATMIDITGVPGVGLWDEVVLMGRQGEEEIDVHEIARLKGSVSYDVLTGWRARLPRVYR